ncbi:MAG TPA: AbrB/MazE/SpoVT family DNA-binding domain-containing protein [Mycobacteriales bacterium]|nr:AbrB/MazE/SpoVT family DNA-binding domain-containing protein [Mycobacteriales bacterium]
MSGSYALTMGDRGRLVLPAAFRERLHLEPGTPLLLVEDERGAVLMTRDQARDLIREQLAGRSLVDELLQERRAAAARGE